MRTKTGIVLTSTDKTIKVEVSYYKLHPKYQKRYLRTRRFLAHDPENQYKVGEEVTIYECKPISKLKKWTVIKPEQK